ncbi:hypothetical protein PAMA_000189 [Pampus argenteus]
MGNCQSRKIERYSGDAKRMETLNPDNVKYLKRWQEKYDFVGRLDVKECDELVKAISEKEKRKGPQGDNEYVPYGLRPDPPPYPVPQPPPPAPPTAPPPPVHLPHNPFLRVNVTPRKGEEGGEDGEQEEAKEWSPGRTGEKRIAPHD